MPQPHQICVTSKKVLNQNKTEEDNQADRRISLQYRQMMTFFFLHTFLSISKLPRKNVMQYKIKVSVQHIHFIGFTQYFTKSNQIKLVEMNRQKSEEGEKICMLPPCFPITAGG